MPLLIDDSQLYVSRFSSVCTLCQHLVLDPNTILQTCKAFPSGIPEEIWDGRNDHTKPYKGDRGIQFQLRQK